MDSRQLNAHVPSLLYIFMPGMGMSSRIEGRGLLFISVGWAVEGLNVRYTNSPHASFYIICPLRGLMDSNVFLNLELIWN